MESLNNKTKFKIIGVRPEGIEGWREFSTDKLDFNDLETLIRALTFSGRYGHLLNNGISPILSVSQSPSDTLDALKEEMDTLGRLSEELFRRIRGLHLSQKVNRYVTGDMETDFTLDLASMLKSALKTAKSSWDVELIDNVTIPNLEISARYNPSIFMDVLEILISNAVKAMDKEDKRVEVSLVKAEQEIIIEVKDNGRGIKEEDISSIFLPGFITEDDPGSITGMGVGLTVAYIAVRHMGGKIVVRSKPGVGSVFSVHIPFSDKLKLEL